MNIYVSIGVFKEQIDVYKFWREMNTYYVFWRKSCGHVLKLRVPDRIYLKLFCRKTGNEHTYMHRT